MPDPEKICVGCESPLVKGQRFGIRRGQLWHSHCFVAFGARSAREREFERKITSIEQRAESEFREGESLRRQREELRRRALEAEANLETARSSLKVANQSRDSLRRELAATRDISTMIRNDLDRVQRELADAQRAIATPAAPSPPATPPATEEVKKPETDDYTGIEARFALLELD
jgi:septation ring formation regulator EzrA